MSLNLKRKYIFFNNFLVLVKNIKFGFNKQNLQKYEKLEIILKFIIRDESKTLKREAYSKVIKLTNPLIYLTDDIYIKNVKLSDSLVIKYYIVNGLEKEKNNVAIKIKKLKKDIEEDAVWTIGNYSFINLVYKLITFSKKTIGNSTNIININNKNMKYKSLLGDIAGESYLGGEATCSTGATGKRENSNQFDSEKINDKNLNLDYNPLLIINQDSSPKNKQKKIIKDDDKFKNNNIKSKDNSSTITTNENNYHILEDNSIINNENNIFSREYISKLKFSEYEYDTFCQCVLITGLKFGKIKLLEKSEQFPASCGHKECSILQSSTPSILYSYQNPNKKYQIDINDLTPYLIFPLGIKICMAYDSLKEFPKHNKPFMNRIENKKGESFYIISLIYYKQMTIKKFNERYKINPLLSYSNNKNNKKFEKEIEIISQLALNETIFVPECISLISRFPYFYQMGECLKILISLSDNTKINSFINHLINQIPVPFKKQEIRFYTPNSIVPIKIFSPFIFNELNYQFFNIFKYFSNQSIITIFYLMLMEQQILFIDNDFSLLSSISFLFLNLIYPFTWSNTYIPVVSISSVKFLESIIPYIMGSNESLVEYALENQNIGNKVIFVNISKNDIYLSNKKKITLKNLNKIMDLPKFPENYEKLLNIKLDMIRKLNNNSLIIQNLKYTFCKLMVVILNNYLEHCFIIDDDIIFNNESFLDRKRPDEKNFFKELIQTQLFSQFLLSRKEQFIKNKQFIKYNNISSVNDNIKKIYHEDFFHDTKILINSYGNIYENLYIDYSLFHDFEKDYMLKKNTLEAIDLAKRNENKSKKNTIEINKSTKIHMKYSLILTKNKKNEIDKKLPNILKNETTNNLQNNSLFNFSTNKLSPKKNRKLIDNSNNDNNNNNNLDFSFEESEICKKSTLKQKKSENEKIFLLFPYFLENKNENMTNENKDLYIKNKIEEIIKMEDEINKIIKPQNVPEYILPSYKRYEFYLINEDFKRYFTNMLNYMNGNSFENGKAIFSDFSSEEEENTNIEEIKIKIKKNENENNNNNYYSKKNSNNNKNINYINEWFNIICSSDKKKIKVLETNNLIKLLINNKDNLIYFSDLLFQDYLPIFRHINSNYKKILTHECLNELNKVIIKLLLFISDELICKQLTLSFFIYGYYNQKLKNNRFIISKFNDLINSSLISIDNVCPLWNDINFWNFWLLNDLEAYKNSTYYINNESISFEETNSNLENNEYEYLLDIGKIMIALGQKKHFIKKCIFETIAPKYLTPFEITNLENELFIER